MARKKRKTASRRRRVSGFGNMNILKDAALATAGYVAGKFVGNMLPIDNIYAKAGVQIVGAVFLPKVVKGSTGNALALGMGVSGVSTLVGEFAPGILSGVVPSLGAPMMLLNEGQGTLGNLPTDSVFSSVSTIGAI